ncbi:MAG: hypothetical protein K0M64_06400 [Rhizobium sp.]|nr:hypothetical protein [Rhizobium sp.]
MSLALGFGLSAMMYWSMTSSAVRNCEINGVPCSKVPPLELLWFCALPAAAFLFIFLLGIRIKRRRPKLAAWLVSLPPAALIIYASFKAVTVPQGV